MTNADGKIQFAITLRGLAALSVLISHYYLLFWTSPKTVAELILSTPANVSPPSYLSWLARVTIIDWGAFGVALFFIISGFVIPFSLRKVGARSFLIGRFFRIYPLYWVGFCVSLTSLWLCSRYFGIAWPYSVYQVGMHFLPGLRDIAWTPNIDGIIWTLEIEMKFYVLCALAAPCFRALDQRVFLLPLGIALASTMAWNFIPSLTGSPLLHNAAQTAAHTGPFLTFMFIGVAFHYMVVRILDPMQAVLIIAFVFLLYALQIAYGMYSNQAHTIWSYGIALLVFAFAATYQSVFKPNVVLNFLADISYPLYVVHGVAGYAALRVLVDIGVKAWLSLIIVTTGAIGLAWVLHVVVEVPSHSFGKQIASLMGGYRIKHPGEQSQPLP